MLTGVSVRLYETTARQHRQDHYRCAISKSVSSEPRLRSVVHRALVAGLSGAATARRTHRCLRSGDHNRKVSALLTTLTLLNAIAAPAMTGLSIPSAASGTPTTL
jgi:hypothetical protein